MKKWRSICVILLGMALLFGCSEKQPQKTDDEKGAVQQKENEASETEATEENEPPQIIEGVTGEGFLTEESLETQSPCQVRLFRQEQKLDYGYTVFVEVTAGKRVLQKELGFSTPPALGDDLYFADIDGDAIQEIIVHYDTGGCGGFGSFVSMVLKLENDEIHALLETYEFDTGFSSSFADGYQMTVVNEHTGYSLAFDAKEHYSEGFFDENGKAKSQYSFFIDSFYEFAPQDVDKDGIYEIACKQYAHLQGHSDYVGDACSILKYNAETQTFEVIDAWFEPNTEE